MIQGLRLPVKLTSRESLRMFDLADIWAARTGHRVRLVSANDHIHSRGSAHYAGLALDFQTSGPDSLADSFRLAGYRVLWKVPGHYGHVHVEQRWSGGVPFVPLLRDVDEAERAQRQALSARNRASDRIGG